MNCPECGSRTKVLETRTDRDMKAMNFIGTVYRRRECLSCKTRFNSAEVYEDKLLDHDLEERARQAENKLAQLKSEVARLFRLF